MIKNLANKNLLLLEDSKYEMELPNYIEEIKSLGSISFYKKKQKAKIDERAYLKVSKTPIEFHELLSNFHKERVIHLRAFS